MQADSENNNAEEELKNADILKNQSVGQVEK